MGQSHPQEDCIKKKLREESEISMALRRRAVGNEMLLR